MLDLKFIRDNPDAVRAMLAARRMTAPLEELIEADRKWRVLLGEAESLRSHQNTVSKENCTDSSETSRMPPNGSLR